MRQPENSGSPIGFDWIDHPHISFVSQWQISSILSFSSPPLRLISGIRRLYRDRHIQVRLPAELISGGKSPARCACLTEPLRQNLAWFEKLARTRCRWLSRAMTARYQPKTVGSVTANRAQCSRHPAYNASAATLPILYRCEW